MFLFACRREGEVSGDEEMGRPRDAQGLESERRNNDVVDAADDARCGK